MVGNFDKTSFPPEDFANHGGEFMVGNFGAPLIMVGNLGIPHHAWWGFYAKPFPPAPTTPAAPSCNSLRADTRGHTPPVVGEGDRF